VRDVGTLVVHDRSVPATAVLVHGAWHGAWCFDRVMPLLAAANVPAVAVDLPGHGADRSPFTDLHGDAARVRALLDTINGDVVLVGHSYGGAVITEAGTHPAARHLVYLCALALDDGESCAAAAVEETSGLSYEGRPSLAEGWARHPDGTTTLTPEGAAACLYQDCDPGTTAWAIARLGPQPMANLAQAPDAVAWRARPSTYVVCTKDQAIHPGLQRVLARRCTTTHEWATGHSPFANEPAMVSALLADLTHMADGA
jgi:pimeloyl-ACP methyl ester carboxylesterase